MYLPMHVFFNVCTHLCIYVCMYVRMFVSEEVRMGGKKVGGQRQPLGSGRHFNRTCKARDGGKMFMSMYASSR